MTCVTYWIAVPHVVWKVRATLIVDWLLLDTLVTASPQKKQDVAITRDGREILLQNMTKEVRPEWTNVTDLMRTLDFQK